MESGNEKNTAQRLEVETAAAYIEKPPADWDAGAQVVQAQGDTDFTEDGVAVRIILTQSATFQNLTESREAKSLAQDRLAHHPSRRLGVWSSVC
jgi:hypothetical protein